MIQTVIRSLRLMFIALVLCCVIYPGATYLIGQSIFEEQANGSIIYKENTIVGSALIGQYNNQPQYFWPRPSATTPPYAPRTASASHLPYVSDAYHAAIRQRYDVLRSAHSYFEGAVPVDMITSSASGLDPHISPHAAYLQVIRIARARNSDSARIYALIDTMVEEKQWGVFGTRRINVLLLNLALDETDDE